MAHAIMNRPDEVGRYLGQQQVRQEMQQSRERWALQKQKIAREAATQIWNMQMQQAQLDLAVRRQVTSEMLAKLREETLDPMAIFERTWARATAEAGAEAATPMGQAELKKKLADALKAEMAATKAQLELAVQQWETQEIPVTKPGEQQALGLPPSVTQQPQGVGGVGEMGSPLQLAPGNLGQPVQQPGIPQYVPPTAPRQAVIETREQLRGEEKGGQLTPLQDADAYLSQYATAMRPGVRKELGVFDVKKAAEFHQRVLALADKYAQHYEANLQRSGKARSPKLLKRFLDDISTMYPAYAGWLRKQSGKRSLEELLLEGVLSGQ